MLPRKQFGELSKSQKNRRLKRDKNGLFLPPSSSTKTRSDVWTVTDIDKQDIIDDSRNINNSISPPASYNEVEEANDSDINDIGSIYLDPIHSISSEADVNISTLQNEIAEPHLECKIAKPELGCKIAESDLGCKVAQWQCQYKISQVATGSLLKILTSIESIDEVKKLPKDSRTLLSTPQTTVIRPVAPGEYFHYGLQRGLVDQLTSIGIHEFDTNIQINVHIDGLPISKSSKRQLYPILAEVFPKIATPFVIGVYHGLNKPNNCNEFLEEFINEYIILHSKGFEYNQHQYFVKIRAVICDSPARSYVTYTKGHTGYYGCSKCIQEGDYKDYRMRFLKSDAPIRTDDNFILRVNDDHHLGKSKFEETEIGMVSQFPVEYMHLVCLGVTKKIIKSWITGCRVDEKTLLKLSHKNIQKISDILTAIQSWIPVEFIRKTRELSEIDRWKATELRFFLLYVGPIVLKNFIPKKYIYHLNCLQCAIRILCNETDCINNNDCAKNLLSSFVDKCIQLYGENFLIYNVHNLIHLPEDALKFGNLDSFSAFSFESYLNYLKQLLKKGDKPLQQLHKRIEERVNCGFKQNINQRLSKPEVSNLNSKDSQKNGILSYDKINYGNFTLSASQTCNSFCYSVNYEIVRINNIYVKNNEILLQGEKLISSENLKNYPINSTLINIVTGNKWSDTKNFKVNDIIKKAVCIPHKDSFIFFPMIHSSN